jgi:hypothetical protein
MIPNKIASPEQINGTMISPQMASTRDAMACPLVRPGGAEIGGG